MAGNLAFLNSFYHKRLSLVSETYIIHLQPFSELFSYRYTFRLLIHYYWSKTITLHQVVIFIQTLLFL